jgi:hypothetical protein
MPRRSSTFLDLVLGLALVACTSTPDGGGSGCPDDVPAACPTPAPSYANDVAPLVARRCSPCHLPGGIEAQTHDFSRYDVLFAQKGSVLGQIHACLMPPPEATPPSAAERAVLLGWIVCGAPQN